VLKNRRASGSAPRPSVRVDSRTAWVIERGSEAMVWYPGTNGSPPRVPGAAPQPSVTLQETRPQTS
jgi:hypothetical protein